MDLLTFSLDDARCAVPVRDVVEVVRAVAVTPLAGAPRVVEGVINLRGAIVPVFHLHTALRGTSRPPRLSDHFVIVLAGRRHAALRVDHAEALLTVDEGSIRDPRGQVQAVGAIAGVATLPDGLVIIHDVHRVLSDAESATLDAAMVAHARAPDAAGTVGTR